MKKFTLLFASVAVLYACNKTNVPESPAVFSEAEIARMNEVNDKILAKFNVLAKESPEIIIKSQRVKNLKMRMFVIIS